MKKRTIGIGIIGAGFMGKTHTYNYTVMPLFYDELPFTIRLIGICNRTLSKALRLKEGFGFKMATSNYHDLLERKDIDVIDICTPNSAHHEQILNALKARKHVYTDKPLCISDQEADDIARQAEKSDLIHQIAFHNRFYPATVRIKELIDQGFLGKPFAFRATYYHSSNLNRDSYRGWRQEIETAGGGVLFDMGSHVLDLMFHYLGEYRRMSMESILLSPTRPNKEGKLERVSTEDHVLINAKMKNDALGTLEVSKIVAGSNDDLNLEIYGTQGALRFSLMNPNYLWIYDTQDKEDGLSTNRGYKAVETLNKDSRSRSNFPGPRFGIGWLRGHVACQYNFLRSLYDGKLASPSLLEGVYIQKIMNRLYRISNRGQWIDTE